MPQKYYIREAARKRSPKPSVTMKRNRKILSITLLITLMSVGFLFYLKFYYPKNKDTIMHRLKISLFDENDITVKGDGVKINDNAIKVTWDSDCVPEKVIWENGEKVGVIDNEYGPQGFDVYYYDKLIGSTGHWKTNNWHTHSYTIELHYLDANHTIGFNFKADGPNQTIEKDIHLEK